MVKSNLVDVWYGPRSAKNLHSTGDIKGLRRILRGIQTAKTRRIPSAANCEERTLGDCTFGRSTRYVDFGEVRPGR